MTRYQALLAAVLFFSFSLALAADDYNEIAGAGFYINSVPPGAKVFIDGVERGKTPYNVGTARTGDYDIRITKDGYVERRFRIVIRRNSRVEATVDLEEARGQVLLEIGREPGGTANGFAGGEAGASAELPFAPQVISGGSRVYLTQTASGFEQRLSLPEGWQTITVDAFGWERQSKNIYVGQGTVQTVSFILKPAAFALHNAALRKKRFNPRSAVLGRAEMQFEVSAPGRGLLEVLNEKKEIIYTRPLGPFTARQQQAVWNGRRAADTSSGAAAGASTATDTAPNTPAFDSIVPDGIYTVRISVWQENGGRRLRAELPVSLDSSIEGRPLTLAALSPGLLFAPSAEVLPAFSYQIEGALMAGKPPLRKSWESLPFAAGLRLSFTDRLEAAAAFNAAPDFSADSEWGAGASVKWVFVKGSGKNTGGSLLDPLSAAAEFSYGWATDGPYTSFGMGTGASIRFPLAYRLFSQPAGSGPLSLDLLASPLVLWAGLGGYPEEITPRLGIEGGTLLAWRSIAAGLSFRWDYAPSGRDSGSGPLVSALEFKFFPSSFVISALGGFWYRKGEAGGFFGAGFGIMY